MRKINAVRNGVRVRGIDGNEFVSVTQFQFAANLQILARAALLANSRFLNHLHERSRTAVQNWQLQVIQFNDRVINAGTNECREQVLSGRDQNSLFHQARGVADAGDVAAHRLDLKSFQIGTAKNDARTGGRWKYAQRDWGAAVQAYAHAFNGRANCLFTCQKWNGVCPYK